MKVTIAQMNSTSGDLHGNVDKILGEIKKAEKQHSELIVFPEMAVTGYCISDLVEDDLFVKTNKKAMEFIASQTNDTVVVVGFVDYDEKKKNGEGRMRKYNAAAVMQNGKVLGVVHKTLLPNYRYFDDKRYFYPGEERKAIPINLKSGKLNLGVSICEDMWDKDYTIKPVRELVDKGADILININASPFTPGKFLKREDIVKRHVRETGKPFVYANTSGIADIGKNIIPFDGQSFICNSNGDLVAFAKSFQEDFLTADLESRISSVKYKKPEREQEIYEALVMSLRDYAQKTGFKRAIVSVSGGIDSALGLALCTEAFGSENVLAYNLPSKFNKNITKSIAKKLSGNLGVEYKIIPVQDIDNLIKKVYEKNARVIENQVTKENIHARIRGLLMMIESNDTGALLVSNGNKTEIALGYATLYGDMCGGLSVIGDLSKLDVYNLSRYVNKRFKKEVIPKEVFTIKPSAELSEDQYDPFDYSVVSPVVDEFIEERKSPFELVEAFNKRKLNDRKFVRDDKGKSVYDKYDEKSFSDLVYDSYFLLRKSVYKRVQAPPIIVVTERAFGFDLRETMINRWGGK